MPTRLDDPAAIVVVTADAAYAADVRAHLGPIATFDPIVVESVEDALRTIKSGQRDIECIVSDHDTPDVDAIAFLETVRAEDPDLPFVLFTSEGSEELASRAIHARATDYLIKERYANEFEQLGGFVSRAIDLYRSRTPIGASPSRIRSLFEAMPDMVGVVKGGKLVYVNSRGVELVGAESADALLGTPIMEIFLEENTITAEKLEAIRAGDLYIGAVDEELVDATGRVIQVELTASRILWDDAPSTLVIVTDRSERATLERRLQEMVRITETIRDINHIIINATDRGEIESMVCERFAESDQYEMAWIGEYDPDAESVDVLASAGFEDGYLDDIRITSGPEPTGQGPTGLALETREPQVMQIDRDPRFEPWREAALERGYRASAAFPLISNGTLYGVLNLYSDRLDPFHDRELDILTVLAGDIAFAIHALEDRAALEKSEERLSLALDGADAGVWEWDVETDEVTWHESAERLFGLEPGTFEGTFEGFAKRVHQDDLPAVETALEQAIDQGGTFDSEFRIRREDGLERWIYAQGKVITDEAGRAERVIGVDVDIQDRKEREQHMRVIDRVLRHNLRNDLTVIRGAADMVADLTDGDAHRFAEQVIRQSDKLLNTAEKEREIVEVITESPSYETVDIIDLTETTVRWASSQYPGAVIETAVPETAGVLVSDRFDVVVKELVENAIVHNPDAEPVVRIEVERTESAVVLRVIDTGPRIPEMDVDVLTAAVEEPLYHGSGLGLWLVHWIIDRSNATASFTENQPEGNIVTVRIPAVTDEER